MKTDNVPGFPGYYISKRGRVFSRVEFAYDTGNRGCRRIYTESWHEIKPNGFNSKNCNPMYGSIRIGNASIYSPKDILNWYNNYEEGKSISEICNQFNVPYKTVSRKIRLINSDKDKYLTYLNQLVSGNV